MLLQRLVISNKDAKTQQLLFSNVMSKSPKTNYFKKLCWNGQWNSYPMHVTSTRKPAKSWCSTQSKKWDESYRKNKHVPDRLEGKKRNGYCILEAIPWVTSSLISWTKHLQTCSILYLSKVVLFLRSLHQSLSIGKAHTWV